MKIKEKLVYLALFIICSMIICCGPTTQLSHLHSNKSKATIVSIRGPVSESWGSKLTAAFKDPTCDMVIAWMESPGGSVVEVQLLEHRIRVLRKEYPKRFFVFSEKLLASGAYWLACLADSIFISPVTRCGSIGVTYTRLDLTKADSISGVAWYIFRSGNLKGAGNPHIPMSDLEAQMAIYEIRKCYDEFLTVIMKKRFWRLENAHDSLQVYYPMAFGDFISNITQGAAYDAATCHAYGLVDGVMWFDEFLVYIRNLGYKVSTPRNTRVNPFYPTGVSDSMIYDAPDPVLELRK